MSDQSVRIVRAMWEAFLRDDLASAQNAFDADVEWDGTNLPDGEIARGFDAVIRHMSRWADTWETWEVKLEEVIDAGGDRAIAFIRERGRTKSGFDIDERHSELYVTRNGKIVYRKGFSNADDALVEAGLR